MDFNTTYRRHWYHIFCYANKIVGQEGAEEVICHAFVVLWNHWHRVKTDEQAMYFLLRVAKNKCLDIKRRANHATYLWGNFDDLDLPLWQYDHYDQYNEIKRQVLDSLLEKGIDKLPEKTRRVIELTMQGFKPAEIARKSGTSVQTVMNQKVAALKALRSHMEQAKQLMTN